jgi:tetratricopeptide (TPR) repeat protein
MNRIPELTMGPCRDFGEPGLEEIARLPVPSVMPARVKQMAARSLVEGAIDEDEALYLAELVDKMSVAPGYLRYLDNDKKREEAVRLYDISRRLSSAADGEDLMLAIGIVLFNLSPSEKLVERLSAMKPSKGPLSYEYHSMMALNLLLMERLDEAGMHVEEALEAAPDEEQRAYVKMLKGCIALRLGDPESAVTFFDDCKPDGRLRTLASFYAGIVRYEKDDFEDAMGHFESARAGVRDALDEMAIDCNVGACAVNLGDLGLGESEFQEVSRSTWKKSGTRELYRKLLADSYLGIISRARGDYPQAEIYYKEALKACIRQNNKVGIANHIGNMGLLNRHAGDHAEALRLLNACLIYSERMGYWNGIRFSYENVHGTLLDTGKDTEARKLKEMYTSRYPGLK